MPLLDILQEMAELEARREFVRQNVERLKKEEEQRRAIQGSVRKIAGKVGGPDLQSFLWQVPRSEGEPEGGSEAVDDMRWQSQRNRESGTIPASGATGTPNYGAFRFRPNLHARNVAATIIAMNLQPSSLWFVSNVQSKLTNWHGLWSSLLV
ncbi:hypothetical protein Cgig2_015597 [Carnegiea gigantea]|uniref:Uncharacterized protein n=1 Tax=Carnegiea gigantea TaxID=171969 RepID=A0A9Q1GWG6_9CARY|nr:hypothetical protein Cgig2_015597 [Carnegiea gigantea]